jgi:hypothetical protein
VAADTAATAQGRSSYDLTEASKAPSSLTRPEAQIDLARVSFIKRQIVQGACLQYLHHHYHASIIANK